MNKPLIAIKTNVRNYSGLVTLGNAVHAGLTGNTNFTTPLPALTVLASDIAAVEAAIAVWGPRNSRGSRADLVDLRTKALTLSQTLKSLSQYVQNTAQTTAGSDYAAMTDLIMTSGFGLKGAKTPQGVLQKVENFRSVVSRQINTNQVLLRWSKPLNVTSLNNVKSYQIYRGISPPVFSTAAAYGSPTTRSEFLDTNGTGGTQIFSYWCRAIGAGGPGIISDPVTVSVLSD